MCGYYQNARIIRGKVLYEKIQYFLIFVPLYLVINSLIKIQLFKKNQEKKKIDRIENVKSP